MEGVRWQRVMRGTAVWTFYVPLGELTRGAARVRRPRLRPRRTKRR